MRAEVEHWIRAGAAKAYQPEPNSECRALCPAVRPRVIRSAVERETAQTIGQGPEFHAEWERRWGRKDS